MGRLMGKYILERGMSEQDKWHVRNTERRSDNAGLLMVCVTCGNLKLYSTIPFHFIPFPFHFQDYVPLQMTYISK